MRKQCSWCNARFWRLLQRTWIHNDGDVVCSLGCWYLWQDPDEPSLGPSCDREEAQAVEDLRFLEAQGRTFRRSGVIEA